MTRDWRPANNGTGKRMWFLIAADESLPVAERYLFDRRGRLIRYSSYAGAARAAERRRTTS